MADVLALFMRWLHISSVVLLIGGLLYGRLALQAARETVSPDVADRFGEAAAALFRPGVLAAIGALVVSGVYNIVTTPGHSTRYHIWLGIKLLLALHVFAASILAMRTGNPRRPRLMAGAAFSGLAIILIAAYLRRIF